jgi:hypothetical protein
MLGAMPKPLVGRAMVYRGQNARDEDKRRAWWRATPQREPYHWRPLILGIGLSLMCVMIAAAMHLAAIIMAFHR